MQEPSNGDSGRAGSPPPWSQVEADPATASAVGQSPAFERAVAELRTAEVDFGDLQVLERLAAELGDEVLDAVWAMIGVVREIADGLDVAEAQAARIADMRAEGIPYRDIIATAERPLLTQIATMDLEAIAAAGTRLRRIGARALREEGMTIDQIAKEFGVSRQRVSRLLSADPHTPGPSWRRGSTD